MIERFSNSSEPNFCVHRLEDGQKFTRDLLLQQSGELAMKFHSFSPSELSFSSDRFWREKNCQNLNSGTQKMEFDQEGLISWKESTIQMMF